VSRYVAAFAVDSPLSMGLVPGYHRLPCIDSNQRIQKLYAWNVMASILRQRIREAILSGYPLHLLRDRLDWEDNQTKQGATAGSDSHGATTAAVGQRKYWMVKHEVNDE